VDRRGPSLRGKFTSKNVNMLKLLVGGKSIRGRKGTYILNSVTA